MSRGKKLKFQDVMDVINGNESDFGDSSDEEAVDDPEEADDPDAVIDDIGESSDDDSPVARTSNAATLPKKKKVSKKNIQLAEKGIPTSR